MISHTNRKIIEEQYARQHKNENLFFLLDNIIIMDNIIPSITSCIERIFSRTQHSYAIICDTLTHKVIGKKIEDELSDFQFKTLILDKNITADDENINVITEFSTNSDVLIAVGSGTINDLCKYASYKQKKDYVVFGTAPSMNGYCSSNASITINGNKTTLKAHLPKAIFFDTQVLSNAPQRLIASGVGDSICRSTCQVDWFFSHLVADTYYNESAFKLLEETESKLLNIATNRLDNKELVNTLIENLILSGIAMNISGGSFPASQSEHMIAHYIDMFSKNPYSKDQIFHGEEIAVTTLYIQKMQKRLLSLNKVNLKYCTYNLADFINKFGKSKGEYFYKEYRDKFPDKSTHTSINNRLEKFWIEIRPLLLSKCIEDTKLIKTLKYVKAPTSYQDLNWNKEIFNEAISNSYMTRNRITFMDMEQNLIP